MSGDLDGNGYPNPGGNVNIWQTPDPTNGFTPSNSAPGNGAGLPDPYQQHTGLTGNSGGAGGGPGTGFPNNPFTPTTPTPATTGLDPNNDLILGSDGNIYGIRRTYEPKAASTNGGSQYTYETFVLGAATDLQTVSTASGIPLAVLQNVLPQLQAKATQNTNGSLLGKNSDGTYAVREPNGAVDAKSLAQVSTIPGIQPYDIAKADYDFAQQSKQGNQLGNAQLRNRNPDGTYSVTMPDGTIKNQTLAQVSNLPGVSAGDVAQADKDFVYSQERANEANWMLGGKQMYNGTPGSMSNAPTLNPNWTPPPAPAPSPVTPGTTPGAAPAPLPTTPAQQPGAVSAPPPTTPAQQPQPTYSPGIAPRTDSGGAGTPMTTQGASMSNGMTASPSTSGSDNAYASGGATPNPTPTPSQYPLAAQSSSGVGNYGNTNGSNQQYELDTRGIQDQYDRGNYTYQTGQPSYANPGETRQQYSQRITDLQNQYNMSQSQFNLSNQGQAQANQAQEYAKTANQNANTGQSRTISGMGLGSLAPAQITGLR